MSIYYPAGADEHDIEPDVEALADARAEALADRTWRPEP